MKSICTICGKNFDARHSYGICHLCYTPSRLREHDRVESAVRQARRSGICPITLVLVEWLSVLSDFKGCCALCKRYSASKILMVDRKKGLAYDNVVPACYACEYHYINGFDNAKAEVMQYLSEQTTPRFIVPDPNEDALQTHPEYQ